MPVALRAILEELTNTEGILGSALIGRDGIVVADSFVVEVNVEKLAALLSSAYNSLEQVAVELRQGNVQQVWIETERYGFLLEPVSLGLVVTVARHDAPLGLVRLSVRKTVAKLQESAQQI